MSDPNRRPYTPGSEPPLAFDDRRPPRRGGPAPVTLIVSVLLLIVIAGGVFYFYRGGARGPNDAPQPVGAPLRDVRTPAPPQPQTTDPAAGLSIYKDDPNAVATPTFAPPPEQPAPRAAPATPATPPAIAPATLPPKTGSTLVNEVKAIPKTKTESADKPAPTANTGPAVVQIGAFSSQSLADAGWSAAAAVAPGSMAGKNKKVVAMTKDGATLYRTSITGFASREEAQALCDKLKAAGKTCFVR